MPDYKRLDGSTANMMCIECSKSAGNCPWSKRLEPLEDWIAIEVDRLTNVENSKPSYRIFRCNEFVSDNGEIGSYEDREKEMIEVIKSLYDAYVKEKNRSRENAISYRKACIIIDSVSEMIDLKTVGVSEKVLKLIHNCAVSNKSKGFQIGDVEDEE